MNANFKQLFLDKIILGSILGGVFFSLLHLLFLLAFLQRLPLFVPLFNQMPWGEERLATKAQTFIPLLIATGVLIGNCVLSAVLYQKMPLIARFLCLTGFLVTLLAFIVIIRTVLIII